MMDVTVANFEEEVIAASMTTPVLIDCLLSSSTILSFLSNPEEIK